MDFIYLKFKRIIIKMNFMWNINIEKTILGGNKL